jgi:hypothetical protein
MEESLWSMRKIQNWDEAFKLFKDICSDRVKKIMDNMQILHERKDSGNDHFLLAHCRHRGHNSSNNKSHLQSNQHIESGDDFGIGYPWTSWIHMCQHIWTYLMKQSSVDECLLHVSMSGMFDVIVPDPGTSKLTNADMENKVKDVGQSNLAHWKKEYENRRDQWKRKVEASSNQNPSLPSEQHNFRQQVVSDGPDFRWALGDRPILNTIISKQIPPTSTENSVDIDAMIK